MTNPGMTLFDKVRSLLDSSEVDPERQEELLRAMLAIARGITDSASGDTTPDLHTDFDEAFEPLSRDKVGMLLEYRSSPPMIVQNPDPFAASLDERRLDAATDYAVPPRILRRPTR